MPPDMPAGLSVAIFGATSVLARELRRCLEKAAMPIGRLALHEGAGQEGTLTEFDGEAMIVTAPERDTAAGADVSFLCGEDDPRAAEYLDWITQGRGLAIDLIGASRRRSEVPIVHCDVNPGALREGARIVAVPHPMAHPLATLLHRLGESFGLIDCCATLLRPAADHGEKGVEELHQQTVSVLSFASFPREVFGRQLAFNLMPLTVQGDAGAAAERMVREDTLAVLGDGAPPLSLRILQAPIFYGHCYLIRVRLQGEPVLGDLEEALSLPGLMNVAGGDAGRTPAEMADDPGLGIAEIAPDPSVEGGWWVWMVADAIRHGIAPNAAAIAERLTGVRSR